MNVRETLVTGIILGVVAGLVVWYLERFETRRIGDMIGDEFTEYLGKRDLFARWLAEHGRD